MTQGAGVRVIVVVAILGVTAAVVAGLSVVGWPDEARLEKLDRRRTADLRRIVFGVNVYWRRHQALPPDLEALEPELGSQADRRDPETGKPYEYRVMGSELFEVCATFATKCADAQGDCTDWQGAQDPRIESHGVGRQCFQLSPDETP